MKRRFLGYVAAVAAVVCLFTVPTFAADNFNANKLGIGYQGIFFGDVMSGLSARYWIGPKIGLEGNLFYGHASMKPEGGNESKGQLMMVDVKAMYAFLVRANSKFYAGGQLSYGYYDLKYSSTSYSGYFLAPGLLAGAEWCFPQLPELGFNFELGYKYVIDRNKDDDSGTKVDMDLHGMNLSVGVHYYF